MCLKFSVEKNLIRPYAYVYPPTFYTKIIILHYYLKRNIERDFHVLDQYIGNMVKAHVIFGMQKYLGEALIKCNASEKIGNTPISVSVYVNNKHICQYDFNGFFLLQFKDPIYGTKDTTFIHYASAAILCL